MSSSRGPCAARTMRAVAGAFALLLVLALSPAPAAAGPPLWGPLDVPTAIGRTTAVVGAPLLTTGGVPTTWKAVWSTAGLPAAGQQEVVGGSLAPEDGGPQSVQLDGLPPGATVHYRLQAENGDSPTPVTTATGTLDTLPPPGVTTGSATPGVVAATLRGSVDPAGADTDWYFEIGPDTTYGTFTALRTRGAAEGEGAVSALAAGLAPMTTYHYRLVGAENGVAVAVGSDATLTTGVEDTALEIAQAIAADPAIVTGASWAQKPPAGAPSAVLRTPVAGFPLVGATAGLLTTGSADLLLAPNDGGNAGAADGGVTGARGPSAEDVSVLKIDLNVPPGATCLSIGARFLSEEFPEFVGGSFNDAFIAELDESTWTTVDKVGSAPTILAPRNFAFGPGETLVSVNGVGPALVAAANAAGTTYDAATAILRAATPITAGAHSLYLSIFDQGDESYDSAVLLDRLQLTAAGSGCAGGVVDDRTPLGGPASGTGGLPATAAGVSSSQASGSAQPIAGTQVVGSTTGGSVFVTPPGGRRTLLRAGTAIPLGSTVDARGGRVRITAASGPRTPPASAEFHGGIFVVTQDQGTPITTTLKLVEPLAACGPARGARGAAKRRPRKRFLWGDGKGRFRTTGSYGSATVRGTRWLVEDSCAGTRVQVARGVVDVRDFARRKTVSVPAGRSYLARRGV